MPTDAVQMSVSLRITMHTLLVVLLFSLMMFSLVWSSTAGQSSSLRVRELKASPVFASRRWVPCFLIGNQALPDELEGPISGLADSITCDFSRITIGHVPDVSTSTRSFSEIDFRMSPTTPLRFALENFATRLPLSTSKLRVFEQRLDLYRATEAGIRSEGGSSEIVVVRKFLELQVARIKAAQQIEISDPKQSPEYLLGEVVRSIKGDDLRLLGEIMALGTQLK